MKNHVLLLSLVAFSVGIAHAFSLGSNTDSGPVAEAVDSQNEAIYSPTHRDEAEDPAVVFLKWFNQKGESIEAKWQRNFRWIWTGSKTIAAEVSIQMPEHLTVQSIETVSDGPGDASFEVLNSTALRSENSEPEQAQIIVAKMWYNRVTARLTTSQNLGAQEHSSSANRNHQGLQISFVPTRTAFLSHPECASYGMVLPTDSVLDSALVSRFGNIPFVGVSCEAQQENLFVRVHLPNGVEMNGAQYDLLGQLLQFYWEMHTHKPVIQSYFIPPHTLDLFNGSRGQGAIYVFQGKIGGRWF